MIDVAFVSGRLGNALFREADDYFLLPAYHDPIPVSGLEIREILQHGSEYSVLLNTSLPAIQERLERGVEQHNALFLLLTLLDVSVSLSARVMAGQSAQSLLDSDSVLSFVRNRLLSVPLPVEQRPHHRSVMQVAGEFGLVGEMLHEVFEAQPVIDQLRYEWSKTLDEAGVDTAAFSGYETELTDAGLFSNAVRAIQSQNLQQMNADIVRFAMSATIPSARAILTGFRSRIESTFWGAKKRTGVQGRLKLTNIREGSANRGGQSGDFISDLLSAAADSVEAGGRLGALESKLRVDKQISSIREMIFAGKNSIAEKYLGELLEFQLAQGDREYAVMSLCSLTAISLDANQLQMADRLSEYAVKLGEHDVVAHTIRAEVYKVRGQFQSALKAYEETIYRFPDCRYALNGYAEVLKELGEFGKAIERYVQVQHDFSDNPVAFNGQVSVLKAQGKFRAALSLAVSDAKRFPYDAVTRSVLAGSLMSLGKYDEGVRHYRLAVEYDPRAVRLVTAYAFALRSSGRYQQAIDLLDRYAVKNPDEVAVANAKATILRTVGRFDQALEIYNEVLTRYPTFTPAKFGAAAIKILLGQVDAAIRDLPREGMESELDWIGFRTYALSFVSLGDLDEAVGQLDWGVANCPWRAERTRMETALGFAQLTAKSSESVITLQHNLEHLEERAKQTRLIFLGAAQAQAGRQDIANVILKSIFRSRDPQLHTLNSNVIAFYTPNARTNSVDSESLYRQEMNLALSA
jgi:tetratricopeptide (TPR) repeat protein